MLGHNSMPNRQRTRAGMSGRRRTRKQAGESHTRWELLHRLRGAGLAQVAPAQHGSRKRKAEIAHSEGTSDMPVCLLGPGGCYGSTWPQFEVHAARNATPESAARPARNWGAGLAGVCRWFASLLPSDVVRLAGLRFGLLDIDPGAESWT